MEGTTTSPSIADPALAASVLPGPGDGFSIDAFLSGAATLYLIAETRGEDSPVPPPFACLAGEIHYTAALLQISGQAEQLTDLSTPHFGARIS